jgi:hypothetical protein
MRPFPRPPQHRDNDSRNTTRRAEAEAKTGRATKLVQSCHKAATNRPQSWYKAATKLVQSCHKAATKLPKLHKAASDAATGRRHAARRKVATAVLGRNIEKHGHPRVRTSAVVMHVRRNPVAPQRAMPVAKTRLAGRVVWQRTRKHANRTRLRRRRRAGNRGDQQQRPPKPGRMLPSRW